MANPSKYCVFLSAIITLTCISCASGPYKLPRGFESTPPDGSSIGVLLLVPQLVGTEPTPEHGEFEQAGIARSLLLVLDGGLSQNGYSPTHLSGNLPDSTLRTISAADVWLQRRGVKRLQDCAKRLAAKHELDSVLLLRHSVWRGTQITHTPGSQSITRVGETSVFRTPESTRYVTPITVRKRSAVTQREKGILRGDLILHWFSSDGETLGFKKIPGPLSETQVKLWVSEIAEEALAEIRPLSSSP